MLDLSTSFRGYEVDRWSYERIAEVLQVAPSTIANWSKVDKWKDPAVKTKVDVQIVEDANRRERTQRAQRKSEVEKLTAKGIVRAPNYSVAKRLDLDTEYQLSKLGALAEARVFLREDEYGRVQEIAIDPSTYDPGDQTYANPLEVGERIGRLLTIPRSAIQLKAIKMIADISGTTAMAKAEGRRAEEAVKNEVENDPNRATSGGRQVIFNTPKQRRSPNEE